MEKTKELATMIQMFLKIKYNIFAFSTNASYLKGTLGYWFESSLAG